MVKLIKDKQMVELRADSDESVLETNMKGSKKLIHICEVCGKTKIMTPEQAFNEGWDYPPKMGAFGIVSPRTCGDCSMMDTLWMALQSGKIKGIDDMTVDQRVVLDRIQNEPASITPPTNS